MAVVSAFLVPGSPLPYLQRNNPPWGKLADAMEIAGQALIESNPDTIVVYSTQWLAVLDQLWQTRPHLKGNHVDENWHEYGDLPFDIKIDTELAELAIEVSNKNGIKAKDVNYDQFPVDTGTIVATNFLNSNSQYPIIITTNNVYHDWQTTEKIGRIAAEAADKLGRKIAIVGIGGLSGSFYRHNIDIKEDKISSNSEDDWNKNILNLIGEGDVSTLLNKCPKYAAEAKVDMGFKHFAFILGAIDRKFKGAKILEYGPLFGTGGAVVEFQLY